jgi:cytochrome b pre-mRNA-processing protein 3
MALRPLYAAIVAKGRDPIWYRDGAVPDTIDGRFEMVSAILALVLIRLERDGEAAAGAAALLAETFIEDMDGSMRELGIGDVVVGKKVGKLMGALGGRIGAFREGLEGGGDFEAAVARNIFRGAPPSEDALAFVATGLRAIHTRLAEAPLAHLLEGRLA